MYYPHELGFVSGTIHQIRFYNNFSVAIPDKAIRVWLGETTQDSLDSFIPSTQLSLVFDDELDFPIGDNNIDLILDTQYTYSGGNLVMLVERPMDTESYSHQENFYCQFDEPKRSLTRVSDTIDFDPANPPEAYNNSGQYPKTTFFFDGILVEHDLCSTNISGDLFPVLGQESIYTVNVRNNGSSTEDNYTVSLWQESGVCLAQVNGQSIASGQVHEYQIPWTPSQAGSLCIYAKVECPNDAFSINDYTDIMQVHVMPQGSVMVNIGSGEELARIPMDFWWKNSLFETIYFADEINTVGTITNILFYNDFVAELPAKECNIWMAETNLSMIGPEMIPATEMTQVFSSVIDFPVGQNIINIPLSTPFEYSGHNLAVMVERPWDTIYFSGNLKFRVQNDPNVSRSISLVSDVTDFDPYAPPPGPNATISIFPKTSFLIDTTGMGSLEGVVTSDGLALSGVSINVSGTFHSAETDAEGYYLINGVSAGEHTVVAEHPGFETVTHNVYIEEGQTAIQNISMNPLPEIQLSGRILENLNPTQGIAGAQISLHGSETYHGQSDAEGYFSISGVYGCQLYSYTVSAANYNSCNGSLYIGELDLDMGAILLNEFPFPPQNVLAEESGSSHSVNIIWDAPDIDDSEDSGNKVLSQNQKHPENRSVQGYRVWRLNTADQDDENDWQLLNPELISLTSFQDFAWQDLPQGEYQWAVKAQYTSGELSLPAFSNALQKVTDFGSLAGMVRNEYAQPIFGATISSGTASTTTNYAGAYSMQLSPGLHNICINHPGYNAMTIRNIMINADQTTTLNIDLESLQSVLEEDFENYAHFSLSFPPWTLVDADGSDTYGFPGFYFPNSGNPMAYIIFNPSATIPPLPGVEAHSGNKYAACPASAEQFSNNDWLISPAFVGGGEFSFWAKSHSSECGLERFRVGVSVSGTNPEDFAIISPGDYIAAPLEWTEYVYDLGAYAGTQIRIAIQCVSFDSFMFCIDDFSIMGSNSIIQQIPLTQGWNFVSLNVNSSGNLLPDVFGDVAEHVLQVKGTDGIYIPSNPYSSLSEFQRERAYFIYMDIPELWTIVGDSIPISAPIPLAEGWNTLAYLPQYPMPVDLALGTVISGVELVKSNSGIYQPGNPYSTLTVMEPNEGYWIKLDSDYILEYPDIPGRMFIKAEGDEQQKQIPSVQKLPDSMVVLARCDWASDADVLLAKAGDQLRGAASLVSIEGFPAAFIQIYCEEDSEEISFQILKADGSLVPAASTLQSEPNLVLGHYPDFYHIEEIEATENAPGIPTQLISAYPNPFNPSTTIAFSLADNDSQVSIDIYNTRGQRVKHFAETRYDSGLHQCIWDGLSDEGDKLGSGIYLVCLKAGSYKSVLKVVMAK
jgi:hypothetical protein